MQVNSLIRLQNADMLYKKIVAISAAYFIHDDIGEIERFRNEANQFLKSVSGTDTIVAIFDHKNYTPVLEVGEKEFWGDLSKVERVDRMTQIMGLLESDYKSFFTDSV